MASIDAAALGVEPDTEAKAVGTTASIDYKPDAPWSSEETEKVKKMRGILEAEIKTALLPRDQEYWGSDGAFHRVLIARSLDVDAAVGMWRHIAAFRTQRKCCDLLDGHKVYREPETLRRYFPWGFAGLDKDGYPVLVERTGTMDLIGIGRSAAGEDGLYEPFLRWVCWYHEVQERMLRAASAAAGEGRDRHKMTCIIDLAGLGMRHCSTSTLSVLKRRTRLEEDNYPEVVRQVYLINAPGIFSSVWGIVKRFVDPGTAAKFNICGGPEQYIPLLEARVGAQSIPAFLYPPQAEQAKQPAVGLRDSSGDADCARLICPGGMVPLAYLHPSVTLAGDGRGAGEEVQIPAGKASEVLMQVPAGALVRWGWATADKDVAFTVQYGPSASADAASSASAPPHLVAVDRSVCGVYCLSRHYASLPQPVPNPYALPATAPGAVVPGGEGGPLPCLAPGAHAASPPSTATLPAPGAKLASHCGSFTLPTASGAGYIVRLRWDNGFSWMAGKTLARRVDVILPGDAHQDEVEREGGAGPVGAPGGIHRAADVQDEQARERERHREGSRRAIEKA